MKYILIIIVMVLLISQLIYSADNKLQLHENFNIKINKQFSGNIFIFETFNDNISNYSYYETMFGINYSLPFKWLILGTYFRHAFLEVEPETFNSELAPNFLIMTSFNFDPGIKMNLFYIMRHEYIFANTWHNYQLRNYLRLKLTSIPLKPYATLEFFYSRELSRLFFAYIQIGFRETLHGPFQMGAYYRMAFFDSGDGLKYVENVFGIEVCFVVY